jgi:hypothetical protein
MLAKIIELITGKDDLERIACKEDPVKLNTYLKTRKLLIPKRPKHFLDADTFAQEDLVNLIEKEAADLAGDTFEPWILGIDGKKRLPVFSSQRKMEIFSAKISQQLNKVFSLGCADFLLGEITKDLDIDYVDLNLFCPKSWEIGVKSRGHTEPGVASDRSGI